MKGKNVSASPTTGVAKVKPGPTGTQLTETGSARLPTLGRPTHPNVCADPRDELPPLLRTIVPKGTASLMSWIRYGETPLDQRLVPKAIDALDALKRQHFEIRKPATNKQIVDALLMIAETIQVELPEGHGLFVYTSLLQKIPAFLLRQAMVEVMETHSYRTMPLPAEILNTPAVQGWKMTDIWLEHFCARNLAILSARL